MPAPSLFCEHKRLVSVCPLCGSARAGTATPQRGPVTHDVDATIHRFRAECHARLRTYLERIHEGVPAAQAYAAAYDPVGRRGRVTSEEEDAGTFRGGFYRGMVKLFDVTLDDRRIQGYNGLADWEDMRDYVFRKFDPESLEKVLADKRLLVHGGNGSWPRQQIATELIRSDRVQELVMRVAFGEDGTRAGDAPDEEVVARLSYADEVAEEIGGRTGALPLFSKVLHVFAPTRWPALTPRATPEVGRVLGVPLPEARNPREYLAFAEAMQEIMESRGHPDLDRTDMLVSDEWAMLHE